LNEDYDSGCCAYTLLVGRPPFESDSVQQTLDKVKNVDFAVPSTLSAAAADFITNLLQVGGFFVLSLDCFCVSYMDFVFSEILPSACRSLRCLRTRSCRPQFRFIC
jgi:serine/threonine protein kinase